MLSDKTLAVTEGDAVYGIPYVVEGYGIIYNDAIMDKYFASENKSTEYTSMDEIKSFDALKAVVEDMTALKDELGIQGVFASTSMAAGEQWRWQTHLLNMPIYYEFRDAGGENTILTVWTRRRSPSPTTRTSKTSLTFTPTTASPPRAF